MPCAVLQDVLHIQVDISGEGSTNIRSPLMTPPWILPSGSWVELGDPALGLTCVSHLGAEAQEGLTGTAELLQPWESQHGIVSRESGCLALGARASHPSCRLLYCHCCDTPAQRFCQRNRKGPEGLLCW